MNRLPIERLRALPFFDGEDYLALNPDLRAQGIDPADHAFRHGLGEGRPVFRRSKLARAWGEACSDPHLASATANPNEVDDPNALGYASIFVSTASEPFEIALAAELAETLTSSGVAATVKHQMEDPSAEHGLPIVVAPHTFYNVGLGALWARSKLVEHSLTFNTAPLHRRSFNDALPWILRSRGVIDTSPQAVRIFEMSGLHALLMRFNVSVRTRWLEASDLDHPLVRAFPRVARGLDFDRCDWDNRPIDVAFFDVLTARRSAILRRQASSLADRPCFIFAAQGGRDIVDESVERRSYYRLAGHVSAHAKVTLHLAEDEFPHFDWHRCVTQTMASGSVAVSDTKLPHPDRDISEHVFHDDVRHLEGLMRWLLDDADGRRAAARARAGVSRAIELNNLAFASRLRSYLSAAATSKFD